MNKRILITGAGGFIGFHLTHALHRRGDFVIGLDNFNDYYSPTLKKKRAAILREKGVDIIVGDICDLDLLQGLVKHHRITHIVHLAAQAGVRYSLNNPGAYVESNLKGFVNVLEICRSNPSIKLTYASSSSVYGQNTTLPFRETDITNQPASFYGATKKSNELFATAYHHLFKIAATGLRYFTVYGPWGRPDMAYYIFTEAILSERTINIFNNGDMERDFTYVDDAVAATMAAIDLEAENEIFNIGSNKPVTLTRFLEIIEKTTGYKAQISPLPMQKGDMKNTYADIDHSRDKLNFNPKISLQEGIAQFVSWFVNERKKGELYVANGLGQYT